MVDDQSAQRLVSTTVLEPFSERWGFAVREAGDGESALLLLEDMAAEGAPVLVLSDAMMPGMGGVELVRTARRLSGLVARFVLFTAHDVERFQDIEEELGLAAVVTKPVGIDSLRNVLEQQVDAWRASLDEPRPDALKTEP